MGHKARTGQSSYTCLNYHIRPNHHWSIFHEKSRAAGVKIKLPDLHRQISWGWVLMTKPSGTDVIECELSKVGECLGEAAANDHICFSSTHALVLDTALTSFTSNAHKHGDSCCFCSDKFELNDLCSDHRNLCANHYSFFFFSLPKCASADE